MKVTPHYERKKERKKEEQEKEIVSVDRTVELLNGWNKSKAMYSYKVTPKTQETTQDEGDNVSRLN